MSLGRKILAILLLFAGLVLVNYLVSSLPFRYDATAEKIYSLSPGTRAILAKIEEPVVLDLYYSKDAAGLPIGYKNYATRIEEMLRQYVRASHGRLTLNRINPLPDTPEEEKATAAGLTPEVAQQGGDKFYFGLVVTQADQQKTIPAFTPQREQFLEYDLTKLIYSVQQLDKPKLGLLTSLPLRGSSPQEMQMMRMMGRQPQPSQFVIEEWSDAYNVVSIEPGATSLPTNLDVLAVVHPENLSDAMQYAIDQFLLSGKPVFLAVDPSSEYMRRQAGQQSMMMGQPPQNVTSDLPRLFNAYGIQYDAQKVLSDPENATDARTENDIIRVPTWLTFEHRGFNTSSAPTAQLGRVTLIDAGSVALKAGSKLTFTPLIETSTQTGEIPAAIMQFAQPEDLGKQSTPAGKRVVAALFTGKFQSAFPEGAPKEKEEPKKDAPAKPDDKKASPASLKESTGTSTLFVIADTDWLFDDNCVRKSNFFGETVAEPFNDNLAFAANTAEYLGGSQDLISIRGKGVSIRPFTVVQKMMVTAQQQYQEKLSQLETRIQEVQTKLSQLQGKTNEGNRLVATPEMTKTIEDFRKQSAQMRGERRQIRRSLTEGIKRLENILLTVNLVATPLLVGVFGLWFYRSRRK
ncbi:MAG TPA: Gldg family protein [Candidatus Didemnitutus sp.]|nr:Gldg family protein [Candidatus Didemnitutus sp.]